MNTSIQPATIADVFGDNTESFSTSRFFFSGLNNGRITEPPVSSYEDLLKSASLNKKITDITKSEDGIKDLNETEELKTYSVNIIKKISITRQKLKEISSALNKLKTTLNTVRDSGNNFVKNYKEFFSLLLVNESTIKEEREFIDKMINESLIIEEKIKEDIKKLEDEKAEVATLLGCLSSFISTTLKSEMSEDELSQIKSGNKCGICIENDVAMAFAPCGHTVCGGCSANINRCHICRTVVQNKLKLYFS